MEWLVDDDEAVEEFEELYSITTSIDEKDLSDLEDDLLEDLDDEEEDIDFYVLCFSVLFFLFCKVIIYLWTKNI